MAIIKNKKVRNTAAAMISPVISFHFRTRTRFCSNIYIIYVRVIDNILQKRAGAFDTYELLSSTRTLIFQKV
jgi:hypothetical protein